MDSFRLLLPYVLAGFFIFRSFRVRVFALGIPFLMFMGVSIFFNNAKLFYTPGSWDRDLMMMLWLGLAWVVCTRFAVRSGADEEDPTSVPSSRFSLVELPFVILIAVYVFNVAKNAYEFNDIYATYEEAIGPMMMFVGYFVLKSAFTKAKRFDIIQLLDAIILVNTLAAVLYIIHQGLHITVYEDIEYATYRYRGETITRTFWFMPLFFPLSVLFHLSKEKLTKRSLVIAGINMLGVFITYTRSLVAIIFALILLLYILQGIKTGRIGLVLKRLSLVVLGSGAIVLIFILFLPLQWEFFMDRVNPLVSGTGSEESNSLIVRRYDATEVIQRIDGEELLLGVGFPNERQNPEVYWMKRATADSVWTGSTFRFGLFGSALFFILYVIGLVRAYRLYMASSGEGEYLAMVLLLLILDALLESVVNWTFMYPGKYALAFWYFALVNVEMNRKIAEREAESWANEELAEA